jgi:[CysO sulfur-carrier protein]-S-L-cysteine hydrolase
MRLDIPKDLRSRLNRVVRRGGRNEVGGVLMAEQIEPGNFKLVDFTVDHQAGGTAHFVRSVDEHRVALERFFSRTGADYGRFNYLGEWHSHPNHVPIPSREDIRSMEGLVKGEGDISFAVLIVVRAGWRRLAMSATLFERGRSPCAVTIVDPSGGRWWSRREGL